MLISPTRSQHPWVPSTSPYKNCAHPACKKLVTNECKVGLWGFQGLGPFCWLVGLFCVTLCRQASWDPRDICGWWFPLTLTHRHSPGRMTWRPSAKHGVPHPALFLHTHHIVLICPEIRDHTASESSVPPTDQSHTWALRRAFKHVLSPIHLLVHSHTDLSPLDTLKNELAVKNKGLSKQNLHHGHVGMFCKYLDPGFWR